MGVDSCDIGYNRDLVCFLWKYEDVIMIKPSLRQNGQGNDEFILQVKSKKKTDSLRFSSENIEDILTEALNHQSKFADSKLLTYECTGYKNGWSGGRVPVILQTTANSLQQVDNRKTVIASYKYKDIRQISRVENYPGGFSIDVGDQRRRHLFTTEHCDELISSVVNLASEYIGTNITLSKNLLTLQDFTKTRLGMCSRDEYLTSYVEFKVQKFTSRQDYPLRRLLCLSENCIIERDPATYSVVCARFLKTIVCLTRDNNDQQKFIIEYDSGDIRSYAAAERDAILASIIDGSRASGNREIFVACHMFDRSLRILPYKYLLDEDSEMQCMRFIVSPPAGLKRYDLIRRFNANIPYNGLTYSVPQEGFFTENKGKLIVSCTDIVLSEVCGINDVDSIFKCEAQMHCLHRLFASKSGFQAFTAVPGIREKLGNLVINMLNRKHEAIDHCCVEMLCALMQPMHPNYELRLEQLNKSSLLSNKPFVEHLLNLIVNHMERGTGSLVIASMLDFLTYAVCAPFCETTPGDIFDSILELVAARGRSFYQLFQSPSMAIVKGAGMVMRAIIEESPTEISKQMQVLSLTEGTFLRHLHMALLSTGRDLRILTNRQLSGHLIALWTADNPDAMSLLSRCLPRGLLDYLDSLDQPSVKETDLLLQRNNLEKATLEGKQNHLLDQIQHVQVTVEAKLEQLLQHWNLEQKLSFLQKKEDKCQRPVVLRKRRQRVKSNINWKMFAYQFTQDHSKANLIWNEKTREEFRRSVEDEIRLLDQEKELSLCDVPISWNHTEFQTVYPSLSDEVKIGDYYLRLLLQENESTATTIHNPNEFFNNVYHRFLLSAKSEMRCLCLKALAVTYGRHFEEIGGFADSKYIVSMLGKCMNASERDHLVLFISKLALNKTNVKEMLSAGILSILVDLAVLAHMHTNRAQVHSQIQSNLIKGASSLEEEENGTLEWYYNDKAGKRHGPLSFNNMKKMYCENQICERTQIWAQGMEQWSQLSLVPQFRWTVCVPPNTNGLYNFSELCSLILDIMVQMCSFFPSRDESNLVIRPLPQVKRALSEPVLLYQLAQLLLTYDPAIVQRVASLFLHIMEDNPFLSRLYLSGIFFFILMYNGSNVLPIARFLHYTHMKQSFRSVLTKSEFASRSVLSPLLPEACIFYLEEYGPEKFAQVFLGEFDNPEIIWNAEMRQIIRTRHLIEKIALHISDFSRRLPYNVKVLYRYCPIPLVEYPELTGELFCHVYYLRHLCDKLKFPNWPIREPVEFLRACLGTWLDEIDKKPPLMSLEEAYRTLGLSTDVKIKDSSTIRRAYYQLAQKYHPDKNSEGREFFEKINCAYELLTSNIAAMSLTPDVHRIVICLQAQSIVYSRHAEELSPYKYAGYLQLIRTIDLQSKEDTLFTEEGGAVLCAAVELCHHTLACSPLNAEQLRRDLGLESLHSAFDRCCPMVNYSSKEEDMPVQVCIHILMCFATAARFEGCREKISEMSTIFKNISRLLQFEHLTRLSTTAAECVCAFSVCTLLQMQLFQAGLLWQLLPHIFHYDFTLDEGGVEHTEDTNKQALRNRLARSCCEALASLAGFRENTPENDGVQNSLSAMLTPFICKSMRTNTVDYVLKILNSNVEDPYIIWDNGTRAELLEYVERHRTNKTSENEVFGAEFRSAIHAKELIVGGIFVRIYNEQPNFKLMEPTKTCSDLLEFLEDSSQNIFGISEHSELVNTLNTDNDTLIDWGVDALKSSSCDSTANVEVCLEALGNVLTANTGVEVILIGHFQTIFSFLKMRSEQKIQLYALKIISLAANNRNCVNDLASFSQLSLIFSLLIQGNSEKQFNYLPMFIVILLYQFGSFLVSLLVFRTMFALSSNMAIVKESLDCGGLLYILRVLLDSRATTQERVTAAELLAKFQSDKLTGPRWSRFITRYIPSIFTDAIRSSAATAVSMLDATNENPELIWNDSIRSIVKNRVWDECNKLYALHKADTNGRWDAGGPNDKCAYENVMSGELVVGGVFLRLFIINPSWQVRHPKQFATELLERVLDCMARPGPELDIVTKAFVALLVNHPTIADQFPAQGYLPQFCTAMSASGAQASGSSILILSHLAENTYCANALAKLDCINGILKSMKNQPMLVRESAHALKCLLKQNCTELAGQMVSSGMIEYLLKLLADDMREIENPAAAKAEIAEALKSICVDLQYGEKIADMLNKSSIWAQYRDQRHDLFLPSARTQAIAGIF
uniref:J domain-containing protein n=1 Tax=Syphacia muris TaxID=451379 RepID=A0A158R602_9BILA